MPGTVRSLKDGTVTIQDGQTGTSQQSVTVDVEEGNLSFTERRETANLIYDRGVMDHFRKGNEQPCELSFSMRFQSFSQNPPGATTPYDALTQTDGASAWQSTQNAFSDEYCVEIQFVLADVNSVFGGTETLLFDHFHPDDINFEEGDPHNSLSVTGRAMVTAPTIT